MVVTGKNVVWESYKFQTKVTTYWYQLNGDSFPLLLVGYYQTLTKDAYGSLIRAVLWKDFALLFLK